MDYTVVGYNRVAMSQGKQEIWMLTFPDRENTGNLVNLIFTQGKLSKHKTNCVLVVESLTCTVIFQKNGGKDGCNGWWRKFIKKNTCCLCADKHREIGRKLRENTGNLILTERGHPIQV